MRSPNRSLLIAAMVAGLAMPAIPAAEVLPHQPARGLGSWETRNDRRRLTKGAFGGSSRHSAKRHGNPAGSKLARKAARGKL